MPRIAQTSTFPVLPCVMSVLLSFLSALCPTKNTTTLPLSSILYPLSSTLYPHLPPSTTHSFQASGGGKYLTTSFPAPPCINASYWVQPLNFTQDYWFENFDYRTASSPLRISNIDINEVDIALSDLDLKFDLIDGIFFYLC
jgi:hypothetical protein